MPDFDIIIAGAGVRGLVAARIFLELDPGLRLVIIDAGASIGGVWAEQKLYPGLKTNNLVGTYEYIDFPMDEKFGVKHPEHIPGEVISKYLYAYAEKHDLVSRTELGKKVVVAEKIEDGWKLELESVNNESLKENGRPKSEPPIQKYVTCSKLMVGTGFTSVPRRLNLKGRDAFDAPVFRIGDKASELWDICNNESIQKVTVYGGGKASHDLVHMMAARGKQVDWVIRKSGHGPTYMAPSHVYLGPLRCWLEKLIFTRLLTWFSPCVWGDADGFGYVRQLLHGTRGGRWIANAFWDKLGYELVAQTHLNEHEETKKLVPEQAPFWYGTNLSILNYSTDIYEFIRKGHVKVLRKDILRLDSERKVCFDDDTFVQADAFLCSTGWKSAPSIEFKPKEIHSDLGIPSTDLSQTQEKMWSKLEARADSEILKRFPKLQESAQIYNGLFLSEQKNLTYMSSDRPEKDRKEPNSWRLWRGLAPPSLPTRDLVFLGNILTTNIPLQAEISSIWAFAYLFDKFKYPLNSMSNPSALLHPEIEKEQDQKQEQEKILYDTTLFNRFGKWRHPCGYGAKHPDIVFEGLPYFDLLMQDLGLKSWRKGWGMLGEIFGGSYGQADYRGLIEEWKQSQR